MSTGAGARVGEQGCSCAFDRPVDARQLLLLGDTCVQWNHQRPVGHCQTSASASRASFASAVCDPREQRWPVRVRVAQQSTEEELLVRATNLTLQAPADPVRAPSSCSVFL